MSPLSKPVRVANYSSPKDRGTVPLAGEPIDNDSVHTGDIHLVLRTPYFSEGSSLYETSLACHTGMYPVQSYFETAVQCNLISPGSKLINASLEFVMTMQSVAIGGTYLWHVHWQSNSTCGPKLHRSVLHKSIGGEWLPKFRVEG